MVMFDNKVSLDNRSVLEEYLNGYRYEQHRCSFSSIYMWRDENRYSWDIIGDYLCISGESHLELDEETLLPFMMPPLTKTGSYESKSLRETIYKAKELFEEKGHEFCLRLVPGHMIDIIKEACPEIEFEDDRGNYDYIYLTQDIAEFKGRAYHGKKNHLNYFKKTYEYEYVELTPDMADEAIKFVKDLNRKKDIPESEMETLKMEEDAMYDVFKNLETAGYIGRAIRIDGNIEALAVGGRLDDETITEHIEKANTEYRGLYQAIINEFCKEISPAAKYLNREEDMNLENLRKAKLSYKPVKLLESYVGYFR